jgi:hypothetical protein
MGGGTVSGAPVSPPLSNETSIGQSREETQVAHHALEPGKSLELNQGDRDEVQNNSHHEGDYIIAFNSHPLEVKHSLKSKHHSILTVPSGGVRIINDGKVELIVVSPH